MEACFCGGEHNYVIIHSHLVLLILLTEVRLELVINPNITAIIQHHGGRIFLSPLRFWMQLLSWVWYAMMSTRKSRLLSGNRVKEPTELYQPKCSGKVSIVLSCFCYRSIYRWIFNSYSTTQPYTFWQAFGIWCKFGLDWPRCKCAEKIIFLSWWNLKHFKYMFIPFSLGAFTWHGCHISLCSTSGLPKRHTPTMPSYCMREQL